MNILNLIKNKKNLKKIYKGNILNLRMKFDIKKNKIFELINYNVISVKKNRFIKIYKKIDNIIVKRNIIIDSPYLYDIKINKFKKTKN